MIAMRDKTKKRIVIALGGNALGNTLPEQMKAVKITARAIVDLIEEGCEVIVAHGNGPQVGMINNAMAALSREDANQPNTPLSVCVAMSQAYIGYDLQNALREELYNREIYDIPVATMITQVRVDADDPAFDSPSKPIGHFMTEEQAKLAEEKYGYIMREDAGRGWRRVVGSPKPAEIVEIGAKLAGFEGALERAGNGAVERNIFEPFCEQTALFQSALRERRIFLALVAAFDVPGGFAVANEDDSCHSASSYSSQWMSLTSRMPSMPEICSRISFGMSSLTATAMMFVPDSVVLPTCMPLMLICALPRMVAI